MSYERVHRRESTPPVEGRDDKGTDIWIWEVPGGNGKAVSPATTLPGLGWCIGYHCGISIRFPSSLSVSLLHDGDADCKLSLPVHFSKKFD